MADVLVELCAGSAAVSMRALGNAPPTRYMGGKKRFAKAILAEFDVVEPPTRVLLSDPGPWGAVWEVLPSERDTVAGWVEDLERTYRGHHEDVWGMYATMPPPRGDVAYVVAFLVLQTLSWRSKPIRDLGDRWGHSGVDKTMCHGVAATPRFGRVRPQLATLAPRLRALQHLDRIEGRRCTAAEVDVVPDAVVYIDPPYVETEGYGHDLPREEVLALVQRWRREGCRVGVSEAAPVPGLLRATQVGTQGKTAGLVKGARREEWLSVDHGGDQLSLLEVCCG